MTEQLTELLDKLPDYLGGHLLLTLTALGVGLAVSLPLGIGASRRPRLAELTLGAAGVIQTVPSLALLALMVLVLGGLIGFLPAFIALTLYSILPILANTIIAIRGVDPALTEAARGLGMSERQMLFRVQLPLAAPVIIAGIRTATVLVVGTATLVTPVGGTSLGNYIFGGLESLNHVATVFGCVVAAVLAVYLDQVVRLLEIAARRRSRARAWVGALGLLVVLSGGLYGPVSRLLSRDERWSVIASGPFTEQHILGEVLALHLEPAGFHADRRPGMSEGIQFEALRHGQIDCMVNYSGNIWALVMKRTDFADRQTTLREISRYLHDHYHTLCLGSLGFENAYAFAMPRRRAEELGIHSVADLARWDEPLKIGGDNQFFIRSEWRQVKEAYGLKEGALQTVAMDPTLMYGAVADGQVDVIVAYTSDGRIKAYDLVILDDPRHAFPPYDAVLLVSEKAAAKPGLLAALRPLIETINVDMMRAANYAVDVDHKTGRRAAEELLRHIGG